MKSKKSVGIWIRVSTEDSYFAKGIRILSNLSFKERKSIANLAFKLWLIRVVLAISIYFVK